VQVDPIKPKLKPPGTKRLKLKCDIMLSTSAFKFELRLYSKGAVKIIGGFNGWDCGNFTKPMTMAGGCDGWLVADVAVDAEAHCVAFVFSDGVDGRGLHSLTSQLNLRTFGNTSLT